MSVIIKVAVYLNQVAAQHHVVREISLEVNIGSDEQFGAILRRAEGDDRLDSVRSFVFVA